MTKPIAILRRRFVAWLGGKTPFLRRGRLNLEQLEDRIVPAFLTNEVKAINPLGSANISGGVNLNGTILFSANDGVNGQQLWKSDGTAAGTVLVEDLNPGQTNSVPNDSDPTNLTVVGNFVFFLANGPDTNTNNSVQLWRTDGTVAGTVLLHQFTPRTFGLGNSAPFPDNFTNVSGTLFFTADDGALGTALWKSDGSAAGTMMVKDNVTGNLSAFSGLAYFSVGTQLWKSDGTTAGTVLVKDINPGSGGFGSGQGPNDLTVFGDSLFFAASDSSDSIGLWKSDGTTAGTALVEDLLPNSEGTLGNLTPTSSTLFFTVTGTTNSFQLWKTTGTTAATGLVKNIGNVDNILPSQSEFTAVGSRVFFIADDGSTGDELWTSDGTAAGTALVKDIDPGLASSISDAEDAGLTAFNGRLLFSADDGTDGNELWISDGTAAGTVMVKDINPGPVSSFSGDFPALFIVVGSAAYFGATDNVNGQQLFRTDGTAAGTVLVKRINASSGDANPQNVVNANGTLFFSADDGVNGQELWKSDGTAAGTVLVKDIYPGSANPIEGQFGFGSPNSSNPAKLTAIGSTVYFTATDGTLGAELWKSDGTTAGTVLVKNIDPGTDASLSSLINLNGTLYLLVNGNNGNDAYELWKSDGTATGTVLVTVSSPGPNTGGANFLTNVSGTLFFAAFDTPSGNQLWRTDGTAAGTVLVKDVVASGNGPYNLTAVGSTLFFSVTDGPSGTNGLWKSDGTTVGTVLVKSISPGPNTLNVSTFVVLGGTLYFAANDGTDGDELWKSDGTAAGTVMVKDINPGAGSSNPTDLTVVGNTLFFSANDGTDGTELWKSDGTAAGTVMVKDIDLGSGSSAPSDFVNFNGTLFFAANDGTDGTELWKTDGTAVGTVMVKDIFPGAGSSSPDSLTVIGNTLFFAANDTFDSRQLWSVQDVSQIVSITSTTANGTYGIGAPINVTLTFDTPVTLAGGNLMLMLNDGATVTIAPFSNAATASGIYTVAARQQAKPLDVTSIMLPSGATLQDAAGGNTSLAIPAGKSLKDNSNLVINTIAPAKIGVVRPTADGLDQFSLDSNGNGTFDGGDSVFTFGLSTDTILVGDWNGSGYDSVGIVRPGANGVAQFSLDTNEDYQFDSGDQVFSFGLNTDTFLVGDWNGSGTSKIGVVRPGADGSPVFSLDTNGDGVFDSGDTVTSFGLNGDTFVIGDWNGAGKSEIGVVRPGPNGTAVWSLDTNGDGVFDAGDSVFTFGLATDTFLIGDWNGSGTDKIGVVRPGPNGVAIFSLDTNGDGLFDAGDSVFSFGLNTDHFIVGRWNPAARALFAADGPVNQPGTPITKDAAFASLVNQAISAWQQAGLDPMDVARLHNVTYSVGTLGNDLLGQTSGNTITIDATAQGHGWSESATPQAGQMDLFTALAHEMGHELGLADQSTQSDDLMYESLLPGVRKMPSTQNVDRVFASLGHS